MHKVFNARDCIQAQMFLDYLLDRGIRSVIMRDYLSGAAGELPADIGPTLWVLDADDLERLLKMIKDMISGDMNSGDQQLECTYLELASKGIANPWCHVK